MSQPLSEEQVEDMIMRHFDGRLSIEEETELATAISASENVKQRFLAWMRMEGRLHSMGQDGFLREPIQLNAETTDREEVNQKAKGFSRAMLLRVLGSLAATIVVLLSISWGLFPKQVSASTVLEKAQRVASELVDRTYLLVIQDPKKKQPNRKQREFEIDMRGSGPFLIRPQNGLYTMGSDGEVFWLARKNAFQVEVTTDLQDLSPELKKRIPNTGVLEFMTSPQKTLVLDLPALLEHVNETYDVQFMESEESEVQCIRAKSRTRNPSSTQTIDLWINTDSGVLAKVEMIKPNGRIVQLDLIQSQPLAESWYRHIFHFPNRAVIRLKPETQE